MAKLNQVRRASSVAPAPSSQPREPATSRTKAMSVPPENSIHPVDESTLPPEDSVFDTLSSAGKASPTALPSTSEAPLPPTNMPTRKRKKTDLPSSNAEREPLPPPKRARGRPKGSMKKLEEAKPEEGKPQTGPVEKKALQPGQEAKTSKGTPLPANEAPRKRGRPKGNATQVKTNNSAGPQKRGRPKGSGTRVETNDPAEPQKRGRPKGSGTGGKVTFAGTREEEENNMTEANKIASGADNGTEEIKGSAGGKTDGIKKRGRPKKNVVDSTESIAVAVAEDETAKKPVEVRKRGRPRKET
ncbi:MAG: hypothetical protein LQ346_006294 [Caloplaca aetnensis]|nr:MAG: hypothetical protein LQ346_006294 [Caloplaca aetnensis]